MRVLVSLILLLNALAATADPIRIDGVRSWPSPDKTRLVFDLSKPTDHNVFSLVSPNRVVVDIEADELTVALPGVDKNDAILKRIRSGKRPNGETRIVLDLKQAVRAQTFLLKPNSSYGHRLVVDLHGTENRKATAARREAARKPTKLRDVVIAIDAGHGGEDPGASGPSGLREKDVVLSIARELEKLVARERGMQPLLVRDGDYYLRLRKRINKARRHRADFFISIHADAFHDKRVKGASVYVLSKNGASSEAARWLAERENAADLIGGVSLDDKDDLLASVLLDLSQTGTMEASVGVGNTVLKGLGNIGKLHKKSVQKAGFAVLKSPDIPSLLVETAFISNPEEERRLKSKQHQRKLARAILEGIREYFRYNAPPDTLLAHHKHRVEEGETLSELARYYNVEMDRLKRSNRLASDSVQVGQVLLIPSS